MQSVNHLSHRFRRSWDYPTRRNYIERTRDYEIDLNDRHDSRDRYDTEGYDTWDRRHRDRSWVKDRFDESDEYMDKKYYQDTQTSRNRFLDRETDWNTNRHDSRNRFHDMYDNGDRFTTEDRYNRRDRYDERDRFSDERNRDQYDDRDRYDGLDRHDIKSQETGDEDDITLVQIYALDLDYKYVSDKVADKSKKPMSQVTLSTEHAHYR